MPLDLKHAWNTLFDYVKITAPELSAWRIGFDGQNPIKFTQGPPSKVEDEFPELACDLVDWPYIASERSISNRTHRWELTFRFTATVSHDEMLLADFRCLDLLKCIFDMFDGDGSYIDHQDVEHTIVARYGPGGWDPEDDDDQVSSAFQDIILVYRSEAV